jgi:hypothetical protein
MSVGGDTCLQSDQQLTGTVKMNRPGWAGTIRNSVDNNLSLLLFLERQAFCSVGTERVYTTVLIRVNCLCRYKVCMLGVMYLDPRRKDIYALRPRFRP